MICTKKQAWLVSCRFLLPVLFTFLLAASANAYTLVMRDGRRIEIPADFAVAPMTLTYEVGAGIQVTVQLVAIDIPATERANKEQAGSLLRRGEKQLNLSDDKSENGQTARSNSKRSITNSDLETFRLARVESEVAYERRRKELGLPSLEESRRRAALDAEEGLERLGQLRSEERESEKYWRGRASTLRTEIAATDARIGFLRARLNELPVTNSVGAFTSILPFATTGRARVGPALQPPVMRSPGVVVAPTVGPQLTGRVGLSRGQVFVNPDPFRGTRRFNGRPLFRFQNGSVFNLPFQSFDFSFERPALITELDQLLGYRAELEARWRELEDEARRAGAVPGWLRP